MRPQQTLKPFRSPAAMESGPYFRLLGPFEIVASRNCTPRAPKLRNVLAHLLLHANRIVHFDALIDELWESGPPPSAVTIVQTYIYQLRKEFAAAGLDPPGKRLLITKRPGYLFQAEPEQIDAEVFECLVRQGRALAEKNQPQQAASVLHRALNMWTGQALTGVPQGRVLGARAVHLEELRINALHLRIHLDMSLGKHLELIPELRSLTCAHPLNEWFHGQLIMALGRSGRRDEALQAYQSLRTLLREELGVDPLPELQRLQRQIISWGDPKEPLSHRNDNELIWLAS
jgi:SARP family transcriptional regulator, regulator of embCAB operon